jgi:MFS family permease
MTEATNPFFLATPSKKKLTLIGIYCAALVTRFISTGTFTLLPMAALDIGGMDIYPLASNITGLLSICAMPIYGFLGARSPAFKRPLLAGSLLVGAAVLCCIALAPNMFVVIFVNFFYGVVSASIFVVAVSMIRDMYDMRQAGVFLGFIGTVTSFGMLVGPALIGLVTDTLGWRVAYLAAVPLLVLAVICILAGVRVTRAQAAPYERRSGGFDAVGALALTLFLAGVVLALSFGRTYIPFGSAGSCALIGLAVAALVVLVADLRQKRERAFIPTTVFKDRNTVVLALCNLLSNTSTIAASFFMPSYIINVLGGSALEAGIATAVYAVLGVFICPFLGRVIARRGSARALFTIGTVVRIAITAVMIAVLGPQTPLWAVYVVMFVAGFYSAQQNVTFSTAPQIQIKPELRFQSNSVVQTAQNLGSSIGMAVYTMIMANYGIAQGMSVALTVAAITATVALVAGQFLVRVKPEAGKEGQREG